VRISVGYPKTDPLFVQLTLFGRNRADVDAFRGDARAVQPQKENQTLRFIGGVYTMKVVHKLVILLSLGALVSFASAKTPEEAYLENCSKGPGMPVPVAVVTPSVSTAFAGSTVELEFIVDVTGKPTELAVKSSPDKSLAADVIEAVKQWRFLPAKLNGTPTPTKVVLPVKIVPPADAGTRFAMN